MKVIILTIVLIGSIISCSSNREINLEQYPQKWKLTEMTGSIANVPPLTGKNMVW